MVLVILAVMWVLVLVPPLLRSRTDGRPNHSISSFQRQLRTLQRTGGYPARGSVTYLRAQPGAARRPTAGRPGAYPRGVPQYADEDHDDGYDDGYRSSFGPVQRPHQRQATRSARYAALEREAMRRRRMNVLLLLAGATFVCSVLAFGMGVTYLTWVAIGCAFALGAYVLLLVQLRRAAELRSSRSSWSRMAA